MWWKWLLPVPSLWLKGPCMLLSLSVSLCFWTLPSPQAQPACWRTRHRWREACGSRSTSSQLTAVTGEPSWALLCPTYISRTVQLTHRLVGKNQCLSLYATVMASCYAASLWQSIMDTGRDARITPVLENLWAIQQAKSSLQTQIAFCSQDASSFLIYDMGTKTATSWEELYRVSSPALKVYIQAPPYIHCYLLF